jgi:hypothetical protein
MDMQIDIPWGGGNIPWVEGYIYHWSRGQNTIGREFDIPWQGEAKYHR